MQIGGVKVTDVLKTAGRHVVPFRRTLRRVKRMIRPYQDDPGNSGYCITNGLEQIVAFRESGFEVRGKTVLEFGSGWLPLIPWLFQLAGAGRLILTDIDRLMDEQTIERARVILRTRIQDIAGALLQPESTLLAQLEQPLRFDYLVPWDAASHPAGSADLIFSRATLEHVPLQQLEFFFGQFFRILRPGGAMSHLVDNSDHWQHKDRALSRVNFLRFDDKGIFWKISQLNPQGFQNRLRHQDYITLMQQAGFTIDTAQGTPDEQCLRDLCHLPLNHRFQGRQPQDLAILISLFVASRPAARH
ncbi:class I SAM-dependent methyltransferase [Roseomonas marmotae]|uniref:Class I SAM-dependent methyltransferase n=1 Tax=Roseomonas marmotae TaxID=2768161 RepID=A0ABS3KBS7_9PROT|nr:class I SAM-dependent methyltransferase [Roseomonas marmotae]MBO1074899.1 class I SAM-dependent methyltransferase [Roseomonas marmotae]QTI80599.1 class I SAM-dependent methyltransferase [Roseomonas marmotae]